MLSASISIADDDGTANATKTYTWFRYDGSSYAETSGPSDTYTLQDADIGYAIYYQVSLRMMQEMLRVQRTMVMGSVATLNNAATFSDATLTSGDQYPGKVLLHQSQSQMMMVQQTRQKHTLGFLLRRIKLCRNHKWLKRHLYASRRGYRLAIYYQVSFTDDAVPKVPHI